jgi:hypothetical protein
VYVKVKKTFHEICGDMIDNDNNFKTCCGKTVRVLPEERVDIIPDDGKLCKRCDESDD